MWRLEGGRGQSREEEGGDGFISIRVYIPVLSPHHTSEVLVQV